MIARNWSLLLIVGAISTFLGCGNSTSVQNQPASTGSTSPISIALSGAVPSSVFLNTHVTLTAVVSNDPLNAGVDWSIAPCGSTDCGTLTAVHTASGVPLTYNPPVALSKSTLVIKILAFATADHSKNLVTQLNINTFVNSLKGTYVLQTSGVDIDPVTGVEDVAQFAGVVMLDGNGGVSSGEQTYTNLSGSSSDPITGGSYFVGFDGRGTLTLNTANPHVGQSGIETFDLVVLSSFHALIMKNDPVNASFPSNEASTGTMDLQTSVSPPSKGYAFAVSGTDVATTLSLGATSPIAIGGVLNINSPTTISAAGSIADQDLPAVPSQASKAVISGTITAPDAFGAVKFDLTAPFSPTHMLFTGYIIDGTHIKLIETDVDSVNGTGAATSGVAVGQGAATGTFKNKAAFAGNYAFGILGQDTSGPINFTPAASSLTSAGTFTATSTATLTNGFNEAFFGGLFVNVIDTFTTPPCVLDTKNGTGRLDCHLNYTVNGAGPEFIFYQVGNGNPPLVLDVDSNLLGGTGVGVGFAYPISTPASFNGDYGITMTQYNSGSLTYFSGQIQANGPAQTLTGTLDVNTSFVNPGSTPLDGTFLPTSRSNVLSGTLTDPNQFLLPNASGTSINVDYYFIDATHGFWIETDLNDPINPSSTAGFGYFATRTPVCQSCP